MWQSIGKLARTAVNRTGAKRQVDAAGIVENTGPIIRQILPDLRPGDFSVISYRNGTVKVGVIHAAIGQELKVRQAPILEALKETFPEHRFERLAMSPMPPPEFVDGVDESPRETYRRRAVRVRRDRRPRSGTSKTIAEG